MEDCRFDVNCHLADIEEIIVEGAGSVLCSNHQAAVGCTRELIPLPSGEESVEGTTFAMAVLLELLRTAYVDERSCRGNGGSGGLEIDGGCVAEGVVAAPAGKAAKLLQGLDKIGALFRRGHDAGETVTSTIRQTPNGSEAGSVGARTQAEIPSVSDSQLQAYVDQLFKHVGRSGQIGDGTTFAAIAEELSQGGGPHIQKGYDIRRGLRKWLKSSKARYASESDLEIARELYQRLDELLE